MDKDMDDERLVEAFACLWKVVCKCYKDLRAKENAWKEVAGKVSVYVVYYYTTRTS